MARVRVVGKYICIGGKFNYMGQTFDIHANSDFSKRSTLN